MGATAVVVFSSTVWVRRRRAPQGGAAARAGARAAGGWRRGRDAGAAAFRRRGCLTAPSTSAACPARRAPGTFPYITNMAMRVVTGPGSASWLPEIVALQQAAGGGACGRRRCARRRRRWWRRPRRLEVGAVDALDAVVGRGLRLQLEERVEVRPGRLLPPARRPAHDGDAVPGGDHPAARNTSAS